MVNKDKESVKTDLKEIIRQCNIHLQNIEQDRYQEGVDVSSWSSWKAHFSSVLQDVSYPDL